MAWLAPSLLALTLAAALLLRWPLASHDVEHYIGPDEGEVVENVLEMIKTGDWDHRHPGYPGFHFYLQLVPARLHLALEGRSVSELPRDGFYLAARRFTLISGVLTSAVVFAIGKMWLSSWGALSASALVAFSPLAARESAVVNPDLMLMLFVTLSVYLSLGARRDPTWTRVLLAGAFVGLSGAIKYTGGFTLLPFVLALVVFPDGARSTTKVTVGFMVAAASLLPFTLLRFPDFLRGLSMHAAYYSAGDMNAPLELLLVVLTRGLGLVAGIAALLWAARALVAGDRVKLIVLAYPGLYLLVFSFFDRAYPRHALVIVPFFALLAATATEALVGRARRFMPPLAAAVPIALALVLGPLIGSVTLWQRAGRPTPAARAAEWLERNLPPGSRILEDQFTPSLDQGYRVHRLRVEEKQFVGNYDWVLYSGYPPGLSTRALREVARFDTEDALGDTIIAYQVPERASLMDLTLPEGRESATLGAGELPYFGEGWYPPAPGAYGTSRLSRGDISEVFFVLPPGGSSSSLEALLTLGAAQPGTTLDVHVAINGSDVSTLFLDGGEYAEHRIVLEASGLRAGSNRLVLRPSEFERVDRRHPDTALRFFSLELLR
jgi:hypothetical protein